MRACLLLLCVIAPASALTNATLLEAFSDVFAVKDAIADFDSPVMAKAWMQLAKMGVGRDIRCNIDDQVLADVLMKAALGNLHLGLRDSTDWSVILADVGTGQLVRTRSFSAVRFAIIECLLLVAIVALGRAIWLQA